MDVRLVGKCINEIIESVDKFYLGISALVSKIKTDCIFVVMAIAGLMDTQTMSYICAPKEISCPFSEQLGNEK